jgi:hypothetical protein
MLITLRSTRIAAASTTQQTKTNKFANVYTCKEGVGGLSSSSIPLEVQKKYRTVRFRRVMRSQRKSEFECLECLNTLT